jgi:nucleoside phosphorylase
VGIGLPASAAGAAICLGDLQPRLVLCVGTCGAYVGSGVEVGDVVVARRVRLADAATAQGRSEFPAPMAIAFDADASLAETIASVTGTRLVDVATTLAITVDENTAASIVLVSGAHVEHLEAYGVATACAARGVPFCAVLGVANVVGSRARDEWRAHHQAASQAAAGAVLRWAGSGWSP